MKLEDLRTPASPVLVVLGIAPSAVERPTTPRALAATILRLKGDSGLVPRNYAVEVAPYWLADHPELTFEKYYAAGPTRDALQTLTLSLATTQLRDPADTMDIGTALGFGFRTQPVAGHAPTGLAALVTELDSLQKQRARLNRALRLTRRALRLGGPRPQEDTDRLSRQIVADSITVDSLREALGETAIAIAEADDERVGFILEAAVAAVADFPGDVAERGRITRYGLWITPTYRLDGRAIDFLGVLRVVRDDRNTADATYFDLGARLVWRGAGGTGSLSAEGLRRFVRAGGAGAKSDHRYAVNLEYRLGRLAHVTGTVGRDFARGGVGKRTLIMQIAVELELGDLPVVLP